VPNRPAIAQLIIGAGIISFSGVWVKTSHVTPTVSAFYRVCFGGICLLMVCLVRRELRWWGYKNALLLVICSLFFGLDLIFYHYSIHWVGPGLGTILPNFQVFILAAVGVIVFKERPRSVYVLSIPLAFIGISLIVGFQWHYLDSSYQLGIAFGLAAALCYAAFLLSLRKLQADLTGQSRFYVLMMVSLITALFLAGELVRTGDGFQIPDIQSLWALLALGLGSQVIGWFLITNALPNIRASLSGLILLLQPAGAFVWDVILFHRPTTMVNWLGVGLALAAIYLGAVHSERDAL
jgi:drug/metabolite transporter (DMT)-like permease